MTLRRGSISQWFEYALLAVAVTMPIGGGVNSIAIIIFAVSWLLEGEFKAKLGLLIGNRLALAFIAFYCLFIFGLLHTENLQVGMGNLEKKLSLLILPLILGTSMCFTSKMRDRALRYFVGSCLVAATASMAIALYYYSQTGDVSYMFHEKLSEPMKFQSPYFGMYMAFSFVIVLNSLRAKYLRMLRMEKVGMVTLLILIFSFVMVLSARTATIFLALFVICGGVYFLYAKREALIGLLAIVGVILAIAVVLSQSEYVRDRFIRPITSDLSVTAGGGETGLSIRIVKWKCSIEGVLDNILIGVGTGDAVDYLVTCYEKVNFWGMYPQYRYNSHNQYLETGLTLGLLGVTLFILCIVLPLRLAWQRGDFLFLSFLALFCFCCLTESVLERQWGVTFFAYFTSLFAFCTDSEYAERRI